MFANAHYLEQQFQLWHEDPLQLDSSWRAYFEGLEAEKAGLCEPGLCDIGLKEGDLNRQRRGQEWEKSASLIDAALCQLFREKGYQMAPVYCLIPDPWMSERRAHFEEQLNQIRALAGLEEEAWRRAKQNWSALYADRLALEPPHHSQHANWFYQQIETRPLHHEGTRDDKIWQSLVRANQWERFLHQHFVGQKRFSLEGVETLIPMLELAMESFAHAGGSHVAIGMAHRGRLNVLAHCVGKSYEQILKEFDEKSEFNPTDMGDVKYHRGYASTRSFDGHELFVELLANPSHLESVGPVVMGFAQAIQSRSPGGQVLPILLHGDGAFAGQGIVYEALQMSGIDGYGCEGVLHLVINNQVGFTASPKEQRSSSFCTDVARGFGKPVFHVNAEDLDACIYCMRLALEYRQLFRSDVIIDIMGYRRWGHNEADEPRYTQPELYALIDERSDIATRYAAELGLSDETRVTFEHRVIQELQASLEKAQQSVRDRSGLKPADLPPHHSQLLGQQFGEQMMTVESAIDAARLPELIQGAFDLPTQVGAQKKVRALYDQRFKQLQEGGAIDWAMAELLAYASILQEGQRVRLSGQDSIRGTFSHRHIGVWDLEKAGYYFPLARLGHSERSLEALNSPLSEFGVLGFEYGYSLASADDLVIWEAQFGDFANGAQVIIDQFLAAAHSKWGVTSRLTLMLPHGFEGQGPEHSSARMERFLALSARGNWCLCQPTTPGQLFHLLRRQISQPLRRPLVIFTPKGLLRHPKCQTPLSALSEARFSEMLFDEALGDVHTLVMMSGRLYYDLQPKLTQQKEVAFLRIEQLYPLSIDRWIEWIESKASLRRVIWIQEEPINMGPGAWIRKEMRPECERRSLEWLMIGREEANSVATGYSSRHSRESDQLIQELMEHLGSRGGDSASQDSLILDCLNSNSKDGDSGILERGVLHPFHKGSKL